MQCQQAFFGLEFDAIFVCVAANASVSWPEQFVFKAAVEAAVAEGVSRGTATALAAEAVERAIQKADGKPISREATKEVRDVLAIDGEGCRLLRYRSNIFFVFLSAVYSCSWGCCRVYISVTFRVLRMH